MLMPRLAFKVKLEVVTSVGLEMLVLELVPMTNLPAVAEPGTAPSRASKSMVSDPLTTLVVPV